MEDDIKQINEIINKLDVIQDDEWQQKEGETEEEYNERIESIEEKLEEEILDYISDSLLNEQKIDEEEVIKEAQEKIKSDNKLFSDAFIENNDGTITLKGKEELTSLGYSTPEEIEKLKEIENNIKNPEQYINQIKESMKASKRNIDSEIDRKMELVKSIISAKKRGEMLPSVSNPTIKKDKFEKANEYIANTSNLKRIPMIQNEYIRNNYISERRYNNIIENINNNNKSNPNNRVATNITQPLVYIPRQNIVTKIIPERKNEIYTNIEKKLDKNNNLTKQKIKARTELKSIFKKFKEKELTKEETNKLNSEIESIKKKYPNTVTDETIGKLYDTFKVIKKDEPQIQDVESANDANKLKVVQSKTEEELEKIKVDSKIEPSNNKENEKNKKEKMILKRDDIIKVLRNVKKYDENTIHAEGYNLIVINELINYLKVNDDKELQEILNKELIKLQTDRKVSNDRLYIYDNTNIQTLNYMYETYRDGVKSNDKSRDIIQADKNAASYYLYLTYNNIQEFKKEKYKLEQELDKAKQKSKDAKQIGYRVEMVERCEKNLKRLEEKCNLKPSIIKKINEDFNDNKEEICYRYFEFLKEKYNIDKLKGIERLKAEYYFRIELEQARGFNKEKTEYLNLKISKELLSRKIDYDNESIFKDKIRALETKNEKKEEINPKILKLLGDIYYKGLKNASDENIISQNKLKARNIYEQIINRKEIIDEDEIYSNLIDIYSDKTTGLYCETKLKKYLEIAKNKGLHIETKSTKNKSDEPFTYVCSDLHGQYPVYQAITRQLKYGDKLYILGDVIDRGPDGIKILQDIMERKEKGQVEFLVGNHELMMIQSLILGDEKQKENWEKNNGGDKTLKTLKTLNFNEQKKMKEFLLDSYVYKNINVNSQNIHLVHARAIQDKDDNSDKTVKQMIEEKKQKLMEKALWDRPEDDCPREKIAKPGTFTIIGHTPCFNHMVEYYTNGFIDIDCGAGNKHNAALVNLTNGTVKYFDVKHEREKNKQIEIYL